MPYNRILQELHFARAGIARLRDKLRFGLLAGGDENNALKVSIVDAQVHQLQRAIDEVDRALESIETDAHRI